MDYQAKLADLPALTDDELTALEEEIIAAFDEADSADDVDGMSAAADALDQVRAEMEARGTAPAEETGEAAAPEAPAAPTEEDMAAMAASVRARVSAHKAAPPVAPASTPAPPVSAATTAAATPSNTPDMEDSSVDIPASRKPVAAQPVVAVTAGADIPGISAGSPFTSLDQISRAMVHRIQSISRASGGKGEQHIVATVTSPAPADRTLSGTDAESNLAKIMKIASPTAIVAAGSGWCAPLETRYDFFGLGVADRPVRDSLTGFQASRGGIRYPESPQLVDVEFDKGYGVWDENSPKPVATIKCGNELIAETKAVTMTVKFENMMSRAYPELVTRNNELALIQFARYADNRLLGLIKQQSTEITAGKTWGAARDILLAFGKAASAFRYKHRLDRTFPMRAIAPQYLLDIIRDDLAVGLPGTNLDAADTLINKYLADRHISVTWHLDGFAAPIPATGDLGIDSHPRPGALAADSGFAAVGGSVPYVAELNPKDTAGRTGIPGYPRPAWTFGDGDWVTYPSTVEIALFAEGTFLFLDSGTLDLGVVRDSELVANNEYITFVESFEGLAKIGFDPLWLKAEVAVVGGVTGTIDPDKLLTPAGP